MRIPSRESVSNRRYHTDPLTHATRFHNSVTKQLTKVEDAGGDVFLSIDNIRTAVMAMGREEHNLLFRIVVEVGIDKHSHVSYCFSPPTHSSLVVVQNFPRSAPLLHSECFQSAAHQPRPCG